VRTIWERRAEVGLRAPDEALREAAWRRFQLLAIALGKCSYDPWPSFSKAHHSAATMVLTAGGERVGKSVATAAEAFTWIPVSTLIWIAGPHYSQTLKEFDYLAEACRNAGMTIVENRRSDQRPSVLVVRDKTRRVNVRIETRSLYDLYSSVVAEAPDLICVVEAGLVSDDPSEKLRLRVSTKRGRIWFSGTLEDASPWFLQAYDAWKGWPNSELGFSISVPLYENSQDFPGGDQNPEIQLLRHTLRPHTYIRRVEGKPAPSELLVFKDTFRRGDAPFCARTDIHYSAADENRNRLPVEIAIDPGHNPSWYTVNFLQVRGDEIFVVDEVALQGSYHEEVILECRRRPAWENVVGGTMDPWAAKQHGMGYAQTPWDIWLGETGIELRLPEPAPTPTQVIDRYLFYLRHPQNGRCRFFYNPRLAPHLDYEWKHWRYERDIAGRALKTQPLKRDADAVKGVGYWLIDHFGVGWKRRFTRKPTGAKAWRFS